MSGLRDDTDLLHTRQCKRLFHIGNNVDDGITGIGDDPLHLWMLCLAASSFFYGALGLLPANPGIPVALAFGAAVGIFGGGFFVFEPAIRAEVIDYDEYVTGERKEGVYSAASQIVGKVAGAGMTMIVGMALQWAGYTPNVEQSDSVQWVIRILFGGVPALAFSIALILLFRFKLTRRLYDQVRAELEEGATKKTS